MSWTTSTKTVDCASDASSKCADLSDGGATDQGDTLIVKIIANSNALSLSNNDNDTTATGNIYRGVELYPGDD